jgi:hypothetical protein
VRAICIILIQNPLYFYLRRTTIKTIRSKFNEKLNFKNFILAHKRARKNKTYRNEVIEFEKNLENNLINIINSIKMNRFKTGKYRIFQIFEPKERIIHALPYADRIVQQWYVKEFILPFFVPRFIKDSFACIDRRGTRQRQITLANAY